MIKNVIFDIGNVLVYFSYRESFASFGYDEAMVDRLAKATVFNEAWAHFDRGDLSDEEIIDLMVKADPEIESDIRRVLANCHDIVVQHDYAVPWVRELKRKGYHVYFLSNYFEKLIRENPEALSFINYMDGGIFSCRVHMLKPAPEIYQALLSKYQLNAEECVFFDDRPENAEGANAVGIHGIVFENLTQAKEALARME